MEHLLTDARICCYFYFALCNYYLFFTMEKIEIIMFLLTQGHIGRIESDEVTHPWVWGPISG